MSLRKMWQDIHYSSDENFRQIYIKGPPNYAIWESRFIKGLFVLRLNLARGTRGTQFNFTIPDWLLAAFRAYEPIEPLLDYLLETYEAEYPWLAEMVASACRP